MDGRQSACRAEPKSDAARRGARDVIVDTPGFTPRYGSERAPEPPWGDASDLAARASKTGGRRGWLRFAGVLVLSSAQSSALHADDLSALVMFATNYFYRGYSKSGNDPTVRGNADYEFRFGDSRVYLGSWLSRIDFEDGHYPDAADVEIYPYVGVNLKLAEDWHLDTAVSRYLFVGKLFGRYSDYNEYSMSLHYRDLLSVRADLADDLYHRNHAGMNFEMSGRYPVTAALQLSAALGYFGGKPAVEYDTLYWNVGLTAFLKYAAADIRYVDYAHSAPTRNPDAVVVPGLDARVVFSLSVGF